MCPLNFITVLLAVLLTFLTTTFASNFETYSHSEKRLHDVADLELYDRDASLRDESKIEQRDCPIGFVLICESNLTNCYCACSDSNSALCSFISRWFISNETILTRAGNVWISYDDVNTLALQGEFITSKVCPYDYCCGNATYMNLTMPDHGRDAQCRFNRSGILCGSCKDGLSHSFGSSNCLPCSNYWLALLIPFAVAGIALVIFLIVCNLTVSVGTINGLIFYANIIQVNGTILLPSQKLNVLTIFISWLNLDFGFKTCFYDGMDAYGKTWLQFSFPLYILFLTAVVIILSNYSNSFARLFAKRSPVAALATLILLAYAKFLRTIVAVFSFGSLDIISLNDPYNVTFREIVWLQDGNMTYLDRKHILLFVISCVVLVIGLLYTAFLLFWQCLSKNQRMINVFQRLTVFMDAYHAPYTRKHRYWTGLLLLLFAIYLVTSINSSNYSLRLLANIWFSASILVYKLIFKLNVYRNTKIDALENSFFANILFFSSITLFVRYSMDGQVALASILVGIAFCMFIGILVYHLYTFLLRNFLQQLLHNWESRSVRDKLKSCLRLPCNVGSYLAERSRFRSRRKTYDIFDRNTPETRPLLANQPQRPLHLVRDD